MNKIQHYILECGQCLEEKVAFNTVTISLLSKKDSMDDEKVKCIRTLENKLGPCSYEDGDGTSMYAMYAFSNSLIFNSGKEMFIAVNDFRETIKSLFDKPYDIEISLSNTGEHED